MIPYIVTNIKLLYIKINPTYIINCIEDGDIETIKAVIENGFDINKKLNYIGHTLLSIAIKNLQYNICEYLIENGADVNIVVFGENFLTETNIFNKQGNICYNEPYYFQYIKLLVDAGCNVNFENNYKKTPLFISIIYQNYEICEYLVQHGANVNYDNNLNDIPLHIVCCSFYSYYNYYCYLISDACKLQIGSYKLKIISHFQDLYKMVVLLVENGADVLQKNTKGRLCAHWFDDIDDDIVTDRPNTICELKIKMKTYLEEKIRERKMLKTCFKRAHIDVSDESDTDAESNYGELEEEIEENF